MGRSGSGSGSGNTNAYVQAGMILGNAALNSYSARQAAKEQKKASQAAAQPRYTMQYQTPYMNDRLAAIIPYILQNQQSVFENRMKGYGAKAGDFSAIANLLAGISPNYSGVGTPGSPLDNQFGGAGATTSFTMPEGKSAQSSFLGYNGGTPYRGLTVEDAAKRDAAMEQFGARFGGVKQYTNPETGQVFNVAANPAASLGGGRRLTQYRTDSVFDGAGGVSSVFGGGGAKFDVLKAGRDPLYARMMMDQDALSRIDASRGGMGSMGVDPNLEGRTWSARGAGLSPQDLYDLQKMLKDNKVARTGYSLVNQFNPLGIVFSLGLKGAGSDWFANQWGIDRGTKTEPSGMVWKNTDTYRNP